MDGLTLAREAYLREVAVTVSDLATNEQGAEVLGPVVGRPRIEDEEVKLDQICGQLFETMLGQTGLRIDIYSEHPPEGEVCIRIGVNINSRPGGWSSPY